MSARGRPAHAPPRHARDHAAVYAAEARAFEGTDVDTAIPLDWALARGRAVVMTAWWPGPAVQLVAARADARSSSARCTSGDGHVVHQVRIAAPQASVATVAHELAHVLAGPDAAHGPLFRRAYLDTIAVATNLDSTARRGRLHVDQLDAAFAAGDLTVAARTWPAPPAHLAGGAIEL